MVHNRTRKAWIIGAVASVLIIAAYAFFQRTTAGPDITVYESPT